MSVRTERYTIRPFRGLESADSALKNVVLTVDGQDQKPGSVVLSDDALAKASLALKLPGSAVDLRKAVDETRVPDVDCCLVVLATANGLRTSAILFRKALHEDDFPEIFSIDRDAAPLILRNKSGFKITVAIALLNELQPQELRPHTAGTWLARRDFRVGPELDVSLFTPEPLTEATRTWLKLPEGTLSYVDVPDSVITSESIGDEVKVYLDEDTLNTLLRNPTDPLSRQIQTDLAATTLNVVAQTMVRAIQLETETFTVTEAEVGAYPAVASFIKTLAGRLGRDVGTVIRLAQESDRLRAEIQSAFGLRASTARALREG